MKTPHNVFALLMIPWLLRLRNGPTVITVEISGLTHWEAHQAQ
jgi:hypothetical protein